MRGRALRERLWLVPEEIVTGEPSLASISHKGIRDALRQAASNAAYGQTVWITRRDGTRLAAIVSVERAEFSRPVTPRPSPGTAAAGRTPGRAQPMGPTGRFPSG